MQISLDLAKVGAKKIMLSDSRWLVYSGVQPNGTIWIHGMKWVFDEKDVARRHPGPPVPGSGFEILCYENGQVAARWETGNHEWYKFSSFYDAVDWIVFRTPAIPWKSESAPAIPQGESIQVYLGTPKIRTKFESTT